MSNVLEELTRQIDSDIQQLSTLEAGGTEETAVSARLARNYKLLIEHKQMLSDCNLEKEKFENEKQVQKHQEVLDWAGLVVKVVGGVGSAALGFLVSVKCLDFERTGTLVSKTGKDILSRVIRRLKI